MNIFFKKIIVKNFLSFKDVEFDFSQFGSKMILVSGLNEDVNSETKNGAGKSTLENALLFVIYGKTLNDFKHQQSMANWLATPKDDVCVSLDITSNNDEYKIVRKLVGKSRSTELRIYKLENGEYVDVTHSTIAETQKFIETTIVPCGFEGFIRCVVLKSNENQNFFNLKKNDKNEFFESLFELSTYTKMYEKVHEDLIKLNNELKISSNTIEQLKNSRNRTILDKEKFIKNSEDIGKAEVIIEQIKNELNSFDIENNIKFENGSIVNPSANICNSIKSEITKLNERYNKGTKMKKDLNAEIYSISNQKISIESSIKSELSQQKSCERSIESNRPVMDVLCNDCLPKYENLLDINKLRQQIIDSKKREGEFREKLTTITSELSEKNKLFLTYDAALEKISNLLLTKKSELATVNAEFEKKLAKRSVIENKLKSAIATKDALMRVKSSGHDSTINSLTESIDTETTHFYEIHKSYSELKVLNDILKPENIRKNIIPSMLRELNFRIAGYLNRTGANYDCTFDEQFEATFMPACGKKAEYANFSSGEQMRLNIACCMAFREFMQVRLNVHSNILIIDEYIDSKLDASAVLGVIEMIHEMISKENFSAYIISHRSEVMNSHAEAELLISKKNDQAQINIIRNS